MSALPYILLTVLINVESGGNDRALGDIRHGQPTAFGCLQISDAVIADVRRISGRSYTRQDAFNRQTAAQICVIYLTHYGTRERLGYEPTMQDYARIWNGGPTGWKNPATLPYWTKVRKELTRLRTTVPAPVGARAP